MKIKIPATLYIAIPIIAILFCAHHYPIINVHKKSKLECATSNSVMTVNNDGQCEHEFTIRNNSDSIVQLGDIKTECSCLSAHLDKTRIPSQSIARLKVLQKIDPNFVKVKSAKVYVSTISPSANALAFTCTAENPMSLFTSTSNIIAGPVFAGGRDIMFTVTQYIPRQEEKSWTDSGINIVVSRPELMQCTVKPAPSLIRLSNGQNCLVYEVRTSLKTSKTSSNYEYIDIALKSGEYRRVSINWTSMENM